MGASDAGDALSARGSGPVGKGWAALRGAGAAQAAQAVQGADAPAVPQGGEQDSKVEDSKVEDSKSFQHWMQRRKMSEAVAAKVQEEDGVAPNDRILLCPFFPRMRRKASKPRRQSVQEYLYHVRCVVIVHCHTLCDLYHSGARGGMTRFLAACCLWATSSRACYSLLFQLPYTINGLIKHHDVPSVAPTQPCIVQAVPRQQGWPEQL